MLLRPNQRCHVERCIKNDKSEGPADVRTEGGPQQQSIIPKQSKEEPQRQPEVEDRSKPKGLSQKRGSKVTQGKVESARHQRCLRTNTNYSQVSCGSQKGCQTQDNLGM